MKKITYILFFILLCTPGWSQVIIEKEITDWEFRMVGDSVWKKAKVPGTIIDNFVDLSDISNPLHPYYGDNEKMYQWIAEKDWEFRTSISIDPNYIGMQYSLRFESLDLFADVYVNNFLVHYHDTISSKNAFVPFEVPGTLEWHSPGDGTLTSSLEIRIVLYSTQRILNTLDANANPKLPGGERVYGRTAQYQFGWDWGPKFVNMGIRKPVKLNIMPQDFNELFVYIHNYEIEKDQAIFNLNFDHYNLDGEYKVQHGLMLNGKMLSSYQFPITFNKEVNWVSLPYLIDHPKLWWPNGIKDGPNVYTFSFKLTKPNDTTKTIAEYTFDYAFCKTELHREKDKYGESFYFKVNGERVFAKGANYVPDDSFDPGKNTRELIQLAKDANMNMIRVWGGGSYPDHEFYDECQKNGIMVWQDYMFACAMYPIDDAFITDSKIEASHQFDRLVGYNNIVVWCGNNENDEGWKNWGWQKDFDYSADDSSAIWNGYLKLFETLPPNDNRYVYSQNYVPSSPKHGWGRKESMTEGDSHYWGVWWGLEPIEKYNEKVPRFMSEFGMQAMPELSTLKKVIPDSSMNFNSPKFKNHQKHPTGFETLNHYLKQYLTVPDNMEDYAYATQVLQAYALTTAIEAQRRAMPYCMGSLIWQLNDCWPVTSWSLVDHELKPKIGFYEVRRAFDGVIISIKEEKDRYDIYVVNDSLRDFKNQHLSIEISNFQGEPVISKYQKVNIKKQSSKVYYSIKKSSLVGIDLTTVYLFVHLDLKDAFTHQIFHFVPMNKLKLPKAEFTFEKTEHKDIYKIKSNVYTPYVKVDNIYEGNLLPGFTGIIITRNKKADFIKDLELHPEKIKCLNNLLNK